MVTVTAHVVHLLAVVVAAAPSPSDTPAPGGTHAGGATGLEVVVLVVAGLAAAYAVSIRLHPWRPCKRCGGAGKHYGMFFTSNYRSCGRCGGSGKEYRWFAGRSSK